jgi:hypothetical protein
VLRLLRVREYKWKVDPETGKEGWLECARFVCDGSQDKRPVSYYAETPDRLLLFLMTSLGGTFREEVSGSDAERAYLNAPSIDRNIVVMAPPDMEGLPRESLLDKGLYGTRGGALSWQIWVDGKMSILDYMKLDVARGVYVKKLESGELVRVYRHSDDFRFSSFDRAGIKVEQQRMREQVKMKEFAKLDRFLGCEFEYINEVTGEPDENGQIVLVRQRVKIHELEEQFAHLHRLFNPHGRVRATATPMSALTPDEELKRGHADLLDAAGTKEYQSIIGCLGWITGSTRPDGKFAYFLLSRRNANPRMWDMYLAVWLMDYIVATKDAPLVLGGSVADPEVFADASFAILPERRSVTAHVATASPRSGAIYAHVGASKCAVASIFEAELLAGGEAVDTALYMSQACAEMEYPIPHCRRVYVDNEAEVEWVKGSVSNKRSRHIDVRLYRMRHLQEAGEISVEHVSSEDNVADILTKPLQPGVFRRLAAMILGHRLVRGFKIPGVFEQE